MKQQGYVLKSLVNAAGVVAYVSLVAWLLFNAKGIFGEASGFVVPLFLLLLFVVSATITGLLVLGKPIHLYLNGSKHEAFTLLFATIAWLIAFLIVLVFVLILQ